MEHGIFVIWCKDSGQRRDSEVSRDKIIFYNVKNARENLRLTPGGVWYGIVGFLLATLPVDLPKRIPSVDENRASALT